MADHSLNVMPGALAWRGTWKGYLLAVGLPLAAMLLKLLLLEVSGATSPFLLFTLAVVLTAWMAGPGPGITSSLVSVLMAAILIGLTRQYASPFERASDLAVFAFQLLLLAYLVSRIQSVRQSQQESRLELGEALQVLDSHFWNTPLAVVQYDKDFRVCRWNQRAEELFGWKADEILGRSLGSWRWVHEEDVEKVNQRAADLFTGNGRIFSYNRNYCKDGSSVQMEWYNSAIYDKNGQMVSVLSIGQDVSERDRSERALRQREAELRALTESLEIRVAERTKELNRTVAQLERTNQELKLKNRDLEEFAHITSHDLQEPLRKIRSFADMLQSEYAEELGSNGRHYLNRMMDASSRMSRMIRDILSYSRVSFSGKPFEPVDLNQVLDDVLSDLEIRIRETRGIVHREALPTLDADPLQIQQVFLNLVGNALKFHREGVPPVVTVTARIPDINRIEIMVADNGIGFDTVFADRIFAPFQRLHGRSAFEGTGIGLAICRRVVERHGGSISAASTPGIGSTFRIILPLHQAASARPGSPLTPEIRSEAEAGVPVV